VATSQIIFDVRKKNKGYSDSVSNCISFLSNDDVAKKVYLEYANCPKKGWNLGDKCSGKYANNESYTTSSSCSIGRCWHGGWDELGDEDKNKYDECEAIYNQYKDTYPGEIPNWCLDYVDLGKGVLPLRDFLQDSLSNYAKKSHPVTNIRDTVGLLIKTLCEFVPKLPSNDILGYLEGFYKFSNYKEVEGDIVFGSNFDPILVQEHYHFLGRYDGRPYKYCEEGKFGEEKTKDLALVRNNYYDYGEHTFCFNKTDLTVRVVK
jgi:hypothetical protein